MATLNSADELARAFQLTRTVAAWLSQQGHSVTSVRDWLEPRLAALTPPDAMLDRGIACQRIAHAVRSGEAIVVFGDYDCDGITSTAILTEVLRGLGGRVTPCLANRFDGGYGVSSAALQRILAAKPSLVVTCDCGSSDHVSLAQLRELGIDVVVIDHHLVPEQPLPAVAFLNPHRPGCGFPFKYLASCGLALSIAAGLRKELGVNLDVRQWLDLVAIGTIADVAPLQGDNRALVRAGLAALTRTERPGLRLLLDSLEIDREAGLTGRDVAFRIAPHINAPGRLGNPDLALWVLLARTKDEAAPLVTSLLEKSAERRALQEQMVAEAQTEIEERGYANEPAIVVGRQGWNAGIVGIVAGRLADKYCRPVVVVGFDGEVGRGSVRGPKGCLLHDALTAVAPHLERYGGHQAAAGLEVNERHFDVFRRAFGEAVERQERGPVSLGLPGDCAPLAQEDSLDAVLRDLGRLEPCGEGNPRPRLRVEATVLAAREVKGGHLKLSVERSSSGRLNCFGVALGHRAAELVAGPMTTVRLFGDLRLNQYMGNRTVEMWVEALEVLV